VSMAGVSFRFSGEANLLSEQIDMQLTLGGEELPKEVRGLQVPVQGTMSKPKLEQSKLVEAIGQRGIDALIEQGLEEASEGSGDNGDGGSAAEKILGDLLGGQGNGDGEESKSESEFDSDSGNKKQDDSSKDDEEEKDNDQPRNPLEGLFD